MKRRGGEAEGRIQLVSRKWCVCSWCVSSGAYRVVSGGRVVRRKWCVASGESQVVLSSGASQVVSSKKGVMSSTFGVVSSQYGVVSSTAA